MKRKAKSKVVELFEKKETQDLIIRGLSVVAGLLVARIIYAAIREKQDEKH